MDYHLAQINVGRMTGVNIDDPVMKEFVDNLDRINSLAEKSEGFVWRLQDETNNATHFNPYQDERIIINLSVWKDIESLEKFTYQTLHTDFLKRRKEWFVKFDQAHLALWWIPEGDLPSIQEAVSRLDHLQKHGPTEFAFDFRRRFKNPHMIKQN